MKPGRLKHYDKPLQIVELYYCIQSEGSRAGKPTVAIRTTGCTHRCWFGEGGWCDSWYTSIHPEKGTFTFNDIIKMYDNRPDITRPSCRILNGNFLIPNCFAIVIILIFLIN